LNYVYAAEARSTTLLVGGNNRVRLWLNGRLINEGEARGNFSWERVPVLLRPGRNTLLAEVSQPHPRYNTFYLRLADGPLDRAIQLAELGLWEESLALWAPEFHARPTQHPWVWHQYAMLLMERGDVEAYQQVCDQMLQWTGDKQDANMKLHLAATCSIGTFRGADWSRLVQMAESGRTAITATGWPDQFLGRVYYRAGRYTDALALSAKSGSVYPPRQLVPAMCQHRLGNNEEARNLLRGVENWYDQALQDALAGPEIRLAAFGGTVGLRDMSYLVVLMHEACELIRGESPAEDPRLAELRARVRQALQRSDKISAAFDIALLNDPRPARPWLARGQAWAESGQPEKAVADLRQAVARGFRDLDQLQTDAAWQSLASRDDFQELVREIAANKAPPNTP
jgi:tetratricopeptide (TPR) repeat protein